MENHDTIPPSKSRSHRNDWGYAKDYYEMVYRQYLTKDRHEWNMSRQEQRTRLEQSQGMMYW